MNNAYMLVYIRESDWASVMAPTTGEEVELTVREQLKAELAAKEHKRRERMQAHRYVTFKVVTKALLQEHVRHPRLPARAAHKPSACSALTCAVIIVLHSLRRSIAAWPARFCI